MGKNKNNLISKNFGSGFSYRQLNFCRQFYIMFPNMNALCSQLNWTQYRLLLCFVVIKIKTQKITHQDIGQLQMYVNYYDRFEKRNDETPTIGILLCADKNDAMVELVLPKDNNTILASKYQLYLPTKEQMLKQILIDN
jgi:hypothetical protein